MEPVSRKNLVDVVLAKHATEESQKSLLAIIKNSNHSEMNRMLDLTGTLV